MAPPAPQLRYAILELTLRCNLRCAHCAVGAGPPRARELDGRAWRRVARSLAALGCASVDLMGGEPLLSPWLDEVGAELQRLGLGWGLLTNGWFLTGPRARELVRRGCRGVGVSLDGASPATHDRLRGRPGAFERALRALDAVAGLDLRPRDRAVLTTVQAANLADLEALGELLSRRVPGFRWQLNLGSADAPRLPPQARLQGRARWRVARFIDRARRERLYDLEVCASHDLGYCVEGALDLSAHRWEGCPAGRHHLGVHSDGRVKACLALDDGEVLGDLHARPLEELWQDEDLFAPLRTFSPAALGPRCRRCRLATRCRGGCRVAARSLTGRAHEQAHCLWREAPAALRRQVRLPAVPGSTPGGELLPLPAPPRPSRRRPRADAARWPHPLRAACLELTLRCNARCLHCGSAAGSARPGELGHGELLGLVRDLAALGCERLVLLGGEPLLHRRWEELAAAARAAGVRPALITNGWLVSEALARRVAAAGVAHVGVSLDGASDAVHDGLRGVAGSRQRAWQALERLHAAGLPVTAITTVSRLNLAELPRLRDQLAASGLSPVWQVQAANGTGARFAREAMLGPAELLGVARLVARARRELPRQQLVAATGHNIGHHADSVRDHGTLGEWQGCPGGLASLGVCSDGAVKGCLSMSPVEVVGNLRATPLAELWRAPGPFAHRRELSPARLQGGCARCPHGSLCRAGCPEMARTATGDTQDNPLCLRQAERRRGGPGRGAP